MFPSPTKRSTVATGSGAHHLSNLNVHTAHSSRATNGRASHGEAKGLL
jgi:hypothetical protein